MAGQHQITERDLELLCFLTRYGAATAEQVRREFFCGSVKAAYRRLRVLQERGMVRGERAFYEMPGVYRVTERGARLAEIGLPPPRRDLPRLRHTLEVLELSWKIRSQEGVVEWVAEREIRRDKLAARRERHSGRMTTGTRAGRTPDGIAILRSTEEVAVELELSFKRAAGYRSIFSDYEAQVASGEVDGIWFYVASPRVLRRVRELSERHSSLDGRLRFGLYEPAFGRGP